MAASRGESLVPAMLELANVCFTGSSSLSLALSLHKNKAKEILRARGVPTPASIVVRRVEELVTVDLPFPLIVKPSREDASVGIDFDSVVHDRASLGKIVSRVLRTFQQPALVEQYIDGREIYVPLLGNEGRRPLPLTEIQFGAAFAKDCRSMSARRSRSAEPSALIEVPRSWRFSARLRAVTVTSSRTFWFEGSSAATAVSLSEPHAITMAAEINRLDFDLVIYLLRCLDI
jgi:hypothetical protein